MRRVMVGCAVVLIAACGTKTAEQKLFDDLDAPLSWTATLQFAGEKWIANSVPDSFVRDTADGALPVLQKGREAIDSSDAPEALRDALRRQMDISSEAAEELKNAASNHDRAAAVRIVRRLKAANDALRRWRPS